VISLDTAEIPRAGFDTSFSTTSSRKSDASSHTLHPISIEEKVEQFDTFAAYAGSYTFTGDQVIHHVEIALW